MQVREYDTLVHLYYGSPVGDMLITDRIVCVDRGFSGNPYEAGMDKTFSLDTLPQEYTAYGNGDYRINGLEIEQADGSETADLKFESYEIRKGKYSLKGLPAMFARDDEAETLEIVLLDRASGLKTHLLYGVFPHLDVITRAVRLENTGTAPVTVKKAMSVELDYEYRELDAVHFYGRHNMERQMERVHLGHGNWSVGSIRGTSSHHHNPFVILCDRNTEENHGDCYGYALAYSGNFSFETEVDQVGHTRVVMGIHPYHFSWKLKKGDIFETPEVIMAYSSEGFGKLSRIYHDAYRSNLIRSKYTEQPRPILVNNWEATYFDFDEEKILSIVKTAKSLGVELFVLDDGWFGERNDDTRSLGDWYPNLEKLPDGITGIAKRVEAEGMKFGLWFEPEMVNKNSHLYREHPDWILGDKGRKLSHGRNQYVLDFSRDEVVDAIFGQMYKVLSEAPISYVKWDMNRSMSEVYSTGVGSGDQGKVFHRYILGVYRLYDMLTKAFPKILFESCASGGGRFDPGLLYYAPQCWTSDDTDAVERCKIQYGTSLVYPVSSMGSHVSAVPNHQLLRNSSLEMRANVAYFGTFGYELDPNRLTEEEKEEVKEQIGFMKKYRRLIQFGTFYRLVSPFEGNEMAWMVVSEDQRNAMVGYYRILQTVNGPYRKIRLQGLDPDKIYHVSRIEEDLYGDELLWYGLDVSDASSGENREEYNGRNGDYQSKLFLLRSIE